MMAEEDFRIYLMEKVQQNLHLELSLMDYIVAKLFDRFLNLINRTFVPDLQLTSRLAKAYYLLLWE